MLDCEARVCTKLLRFQPFWVSYSFCYFRALGAYKKLNLKRNFDQRKKRLDKTVVCIKTGHFKETIYYHLYSAKYLRSYAVK
jgi:hypothetical protein